MAEVQFIVVTLDGVENLELEADSEGRFTLTCLDSLVGVLSVGLRYLSKNSRFRGVRVANGELLRPPDGWKSEERIYRVVVKANNDLLMPPMTPIAKDQGPLLVKLEDDNVLNAGAGTCPICILKLSNYSLYIYI